MNQNFNMLIGNCTCINSQIPKSNSISMHVHFITSYREPFRVHVLWVNKITLTFMDCEQSVFVPEKRYVRPKAARRSQKS